MNKYQIIKVALESSDWTTLLAFHKATLDFMAKRFAENPIYYSKAARIADEISRQVFDKITPEDVSLMVENYHSHE